MQPYITHRAHTLDTISCQMHWIDGHLAMHGITHLLPSPPPSLSLPTPTWYDHTMHTQKVARLVQTHTKARKRAPIFSTGWMVLGAQVGGPRVLCGKGWQAGSQRLLPGLWGVCDPVLTSPSYTGERPGADGGWALRASFWAVRAFLHLSK